MRTRIISCVTFMLILTILSSSLAPALGSDFVVEKENETKILFRNMPRFSIEEIIDNETIISDSLIYVNQTIDILSSGNLTLVNCVVDINESEVGFDLKGGILNIENSKLLYGNGIVTGDSDGIFYMNNGTIQSSYDDALELHGQYEITILNSKFVGNDKDSIEFRYSNIPIFINNTHFDNSGKDALNLEDVNITIHNCLMTDSGDEGIQLEGVSDLYVDNVTIARNGRGDGIKVRQVNGTVKINDVNIYGGSDDAIQVTLGYSDISIKNAYLHDNGENGIEVDNPINVIVEDSRISNNGVRGIEGLNITSLTVVSTLIERSGDQGIYVVNADNVTVRNCTLNTNEAAGVDITKTDEFTMLGCYVMNSASQKHPEGSNGISLQFANSTLVKNSSIKSNTGYGIRLVATSLADIIQNIIEENENGGIVVRNNSIVSIQNNTIQSNQKDGIYFDSTAQGHVSYNTIQNNQGYGLFAEKRDDDQKIEANYNYWGSNKGPSIRVSDDIRDEIKGPIEITHILTEDNTIKEYNIPVVVVFFVDNIWAFILVLFLATALIAIISIVTYLYLRKQKFYRTTKPKQMLLISNAGIPLVHHDFTEQKSDEILFSGFLAAKNSFVAEITSGYSEMDDESEEKRSLREIFHMNFVIILRPVSNFLISLITERSNPLIRRDMNSFAEEFRIFANSIKDEPRLMDTEFWGKQEIIEELIAKYFDDYNI